LAIGLFMAFACIHIPEFPVQAAVRGEPELTLRPHGRTPFDFAQGKQGKGGRALALLDGVAPLCRVAAASKAALAAGIEIGMAKAQVEQFRGVEWRRRSPEQERNAHAALLDLGGSFSPRVEDTAPETILLDLAGLDALFGGAESVARRLAQGARDVCGLAAHVAVAANPDAALHAARGAILSEQGCPGVTVIADGEEAARLGPLPVRVLGASAEALETFERWGVRNCAALAALPVLELSERLGAEGVQLHQWARGAGRRSLRLSEPALCFEEELALEYEVTELEPLAFLLSRLLEALCARLAARSLAASAVTLRLALARHPSAVLRASGGQAPTAQETGGIPRCARDDEPNRFVKCLSLPAPLRNAKLLLNLLRLQLQGDPPGAPVRGIFLAAEPARPRAAQGGLFVPSGPDPEKLELTLARLAHLVGESRVGSPQLVDTHRPDTFRMRRFAPAPAGRPATAGKLSTETNEATPPGPEHRTGFRMFRPAVAARVEMRDGRPARVFFHGLRGTVVAASGPWRGSGDWWERDAWQQDEWDLEIEFSGGGQMSHLPLPFPKQVKPREARRGLYRFAYDEVRRVWLVRGVFD
jgi:protein ImuB